MAKYKRWSDCANGMVSITVTPDYHAPADRYGKPAYKLRVAKRGMKTWAPKDPLYSWQPSRARKRGGESLADDAVGFFDHYRCGEGRGEGRSGVDGLCRRRPKRRRR